MNKLLLPVSYKDACILKHSLKKSMSEKEGIVIAANKVGDLDKAKEQVVDLISEKKVYADIKLIIDQYKDQDRARESARESEVKEFALCLEDRLIGLGQLEG